ncbi:MAG: BrnT family toxin [Croceibacterium sp.]
MGVIFDEAKRLATLQARGLDFADAVTIWDGPTFTVADERREYPEERFITYGIMAERQVVVVWTWRNGDRRIISLRKANEREQARFRRRMV